MKTQVESKAFPYAGYYIMREGNFYMIIDCIPLDPKVPLGHIHNNRLGFELFANNKSFIIDPGSYVYTADKNMRNLFRSTQYHNTAVIDKEEQNRFDNNIFKVETDAGVKINKWESNKDYDFLDAEHTGYLRLKNKVLHRRQIYFNKREGKYWIIKDIFIGEGEHLFELYFHFALTDIDYDKEDPVVVKSKAEDGYNLAIVPLKKQDITVEILKGWTSSRYGEKIEAPVVKYSKKSIAPTSLINILVPFKDSMEISLTINKVLSDIKGTEFKI